MLAFFVLHERVEWPQVLGGVLILGAVLMLQVGGFGGKEITPVPEE